MTGAINMLVRLIPPALGTLALFLAFSFFLAEGRRRQPQRLVDAVVELALSGDYESAEECYGTMKELGPRAIPPAAELLRSEDDFVRTLGAELVQELIEELRERGGLEPLPREVRAALPLLEATLDDAVPKVRGKAASALGWVGGAATDTLPEIEKLLTDEDRSVRERAQRATRRIRSGAEG